MELGSISSAPRTVEEIFKDYSGRRAGIVRALTHDVDEFYAQCDPDKENLCLYGHSNDMWEVNLPAEEVPPELPEPALGINFARDVMSRRDWLSLIAMHSDSWLLSVAFYLGARLNRNERLGWTETHHWVVSCFDISSLVDGKNLFQIEDDQKKSLVWTLQIN
ncbi:PHD finger protein ALFIN-LIKE 2-like isoform X3 [Zingiber officinale]|uniref:PHD finger protein ALFIN-LIKE 2-like isoform X3 n=1 Tax=Zingiber officinale TaxID=94328 RepID=UPI001C4D38D2|nr:PHD finger protein ALFIN-LIKE 2-like isoform X3 [Zingiber officinale]